MRIVEVAFPIPLDRTFHYLIGDGISSLKPGMRVKAPFGTRKLTGFVVSIFEGEPARPLKPIDEILDPEPLLDLEGFNCALWMSKRYGAPLGECLKSVLPSFIKFPSLNSRKKKKVPLSEEKKKEKGAEFVLTPDQAAALSKLADRLSLNQFHAALIYGVPASGKTEVYRRLILQTVKSGAQALFLVPEISLAGPFFKEFSSLFDFPVDLWHSQVPLGKRKQAWMGLRQGEPRLVVGARSASLLPFKNLKLIVIDEEQDESFKQEGQIPYYHARDVAFFRAKAHQSLLILGSATPSLESWSQAEKGEIELIEMSRRVSLIARPSVVTVLPPTQGKTLSNTLVAKIQERLFRREQVILLVNRRGFSTLILCSRCGWAARCPSCGVAKIAHESSDGKLFLQCHHCDAKTPLPQSCEKCGHAVLRSIGAGTQKIVSELKSVLPMGRVLRLDRDSLSEDNKEEKKIYEKFLSQEADILVGTKLIAKSFHFPNVTLVGVVDSDLMLSMPDFRASERAMQLLAQVAGRSGRADKPGEVILQTLSPAHPAVSQTISGDYARFAEEELKARKDLRYPPYCSLTRLVWESEDKARVRQAAADAAEILKDTLKISGHECVGPSPCVLSILRNFHREHLLIKSPSERWQEALSAARNLKTPKGVYFKINSDPYDLF